MLLTNSLIKLEVTEYFYGGVLLTDVSSMDTIIIDTFKTWDDCFKVAAAMLASSDFEASLDI